MEAFLYYGSVYLIEALIIWQYCSFMLPSRFSTSITFSISIPLYLITFLFSLQEDILVNFISFLLINLLYIFLAFKCSWYVALFHSSIATVIMSLSEILCMALFSQLTYTFYNDALLPQNLTVLAISSKLLYFIILQTIAFIFGNKKKHPTNFDRIIPMLALICISTGVTLATFALLTVKLQPTEDIDHMIGVSSLLLLGINIIVLIIYNNNLQKNNEFTNLELQLQHEVDSVEYYKMLIQQHENQSILIHDIKKHLNSIALLNEQQDYDKVAAYIDQIIISPALQKSIYYCNNQMLNMILSRYASDCREQRINFHPDIRTNSLDFVNDEDLTALFCNLLDNSVEAAEKQNDSYIDLSVVRRENTPFTIITVLNSCRTNPFSPETGKLISRKEDSSRHGYGIKSIQRIVKKYDGEMQMYYDEETLTFHTIIALKNQDRL